VSAALPEGPTTTLCGIPPAPSPQRRRRRHSRAIQSPDSARSTRNRSYCATDPHTDGTPREAPASLGSSLPPIPTASIPRIPLAIRGLRLQADPPRAEKNNREPDTDWQPTYPIGTHGRNPWTSTTGSGDEPSAVIRAAHDTHTVRRLRPLARRRLSTARPALVDIRTRNPCVFFRLRLFGWYVRFTAPLFSPTHERASGPCSLKEQGSIQGFHRCRQTPEGNATPTAIFPLTARTRTPRGNAAQSTGTGSCGQPSRGVQLSQRPCGCRTPDARQESARRAPKRPVR